MPDRTPKADIPFSTPLPSTPGNRDRGMKDRNGRLPPLQHYSGEGWLVLAADGDHASRIELMSDWVPITTTLSVSEITLRRWVIATIVT